MAHYPWVVFESLTISPYFVEFDVLTTNGRRRGIRTSLQWLLEDTSGDQAS